VTATLPTPIGSSEARPPQSHTERSDRRFIVNQPARITVAGLPDEEWEARIRDISRRGMQFTVDRPLPVRSRLRIEWSGREICGSIRYQRPDEAGYRLGVELSTSWESLVADMLEQQAEELREAEASLKKSNEELAAALELAREASSAKSRFLAGVSHELRTPLNGIIGFSQMLHDGGLGSVTQDQKDCLADVLKCSGHLLTLINHVLDLTKIEAGKMEFHYEEVDLRELAAATVERVAPLAAAKRIAIEVASEDGLQAVPADAGKLRQVLLNYLSNAIKFTPEEGSVRVELRREGAHAYRLTVADTGMGIEPGDIERLFTEFGQLGEAYKAKNGSGLGLAITRQIVERQGGRVGVDSVPGEGSRFYAVLPGR
jgi:signal transduction histidine kinase